MYGGAAPWNNPQNYKRTHKKKYTIEVSMPPEGTVVFNHLENVVYKTSKEKPFVLTGTRGEQWVIDPAKLCKTYTLEDGSPLTKEVLQRKVVPGWKDCVKYPCIKPFRITSIPGVDNWAIHVPKQYVFQIPTSWGDVLTVNNPEQDHDLGDYIVCADAGGYPNLNDRWVVNGSVFPDTYDMRAFPNMSRGGPDYRNTAPFSHNEFLGVTWNQLHSMAYTAGELHRSRKAMEEAKANRPKSRSKEECYQIFKRLASEVCLHLHREYPGVFGKPKAGLNKKSVFLNYNDNKPFNKKGLEISYSFDCDDPDMQQIDVTAHHDGTQTAIGFTFEETDINFVMSQIRPLIMDCFKQ